MGREIVAAALDVVDGPGVSALSLRGLAREIGVSAPAIYAHFANVDAILLAAAEQVFDDLAEHLQAAVRSVDRPQFQLRELCRAYLEYAQRHSGRYLLAFGGQWDATSAVERGSIAPTPVAQLGQDVLTFFVRAVQDRPPNTGPPGPSTPDGSAEMDDFNEAIITWVFLHGYAHQRIVARAFPWPQTITDQLLDRLAPMDHSSEGVRTPRR